MYNAEIASELRRLATALDQQNELPATAVFDTPEYWHYGEGGYIFTDPRGKLSKACHGELPCKCGNYYSGHVVCETVQPSLIPVLTNVPQMIDVLTQLVRAVCPSKNAKPVTTVALYAETLLHRMGINPLQNEIPALLSAGDQGSAS